MDFYCPNEKEASNETTDELERITAEGGNSVRRQQAGNEKESGNRCNLWRGRTEEKSFAEKEFNGCGTSENLEQEHEACSKEATNEKQNSSSTSVNAKRCITTADTGSVYWQTRTSTAGAVAGNSQHRTASAVNTDVEDQVSAVTASKKE